ncbi:hypothetical protein [Nonomuraea sp. NPDC050783]|uniref:hypothetical protein n=1 Tax=Nonomuraea sp. NPDC050783 TaxID=3154634 RepID=UPI0034667BCD
MTGQPDLPDAWWRSLPMPRVLAAIGPEALAELLTEIALEHWPAAAVGDVLPALHVLDPEEADEPPVAIALDRAGSWPGLLALTGRELADQPFIKARPVLSTLFSAVFTRLAHPHAGGAAEPAAPAVPAPRIETAPAVAPAEAGEPLPLPAAAPPAEIPPVQEDVQEPVQEDERPEEPAPPHAAGPPEEEASAERASEDGTHDGIPDDGTPGDGTPDDHAEPAGFRSVEPGVAEPGPAEPEDAEQDGDVPAAAAEAIPEVHEPHDAHEHSDAHEPSDDEEQDPAHAFAEQAAPVRDAAEQAQEAGDPGEGRDVGEGDPADERPVLDADAEPVTDEGDGPEPTPDSAEEPAPEPAAEEAEAAEKAEEAEAAAAPGALESGEPTADDEVEEPQPAGAPVHHELPDLIEAAFAGLDDKSWAVAQNRVFTDEPSAVDQLAKLFAVPPEEITATEEEFRVRLGEWLTSDEAAPYRAHLDELRKTLGPAAPKEQVIGAADWHKVEIRALEVPAWQFVMATLPPQAATPRGESQRGEPPHREPPRKEPLQKRVPQKLTGPRPQPDLPHPPRLDPVLHFDPPPRQQPPMDMPPHSAFGPVPLPPSPAPGMPQFQAFRPTAAHERNGGSGEQKPYQPLKDVSQTRRCFRQPDGRWWLRVDVTAEQMAGGECALPTGFAAYLGLSPGESRTVRSAAGELTMTWHGRPVLESIEHLLADVGAREGGHLFLTLSDEGVLRARHLPVAAQGAEKITKALRLVGYTAPGGTRDQAARVIATRIGMTGPVSLPDLLTRLRERGDRDLLALLD